MHRAEQLGEVLAPGPAFGQVQGEAAGGAGQAGGHDAIRAATPKAQVAGPVLDGRAHTFAFGDELDVRPIRGADFNGQQELTDRAVAAYIAKYATKGAETATGALDRPIRLIAEVAHLDITDHARRLIRTAWALCARKDLAPPSARSATPAPHGDVPKPPPSWSRTRPRSSSPTGPTPVPASPPPRNGSPPPSPPLPERKENPPMRNWTRPLGGEAATAIRALDPDPTLLLLTVEEAARRLGIGRTTCFGLLASGELESVRVGSLRRIPAEALSSYVTRLRTTSVGAA